MGRGSSLYSSLACQQTPGARCARVMWLKRNDGIEPNARSITVHVAEEGAGQQRGDRRGRLRGGCCTDTKKTSEQAQKKEAQTGTDERASDSRPARALSLCVLATMLSYFFCDFLSSLSSQPSTARTNLLLLSPSRRFPSPHMRAPSAGPLCLLRTSRVCSDCPQLCESTPRTAPPTKAAVCQPQE